MRYQQERGFSLIEVSISLAIVSIALVPTASAWLAISQANQAIGRKAEALVVAQQVIEREVRSKPYNPSPSNIGPLTDPTSNLVYQLTWDTVDTNLSRAIVTVKPSLSAPPLIRMVTLVAPEDLL